MRIKTVTITGADDSISVDELVNISKEFPYVEWAILLSKKKVGTNRFPSKKWMEKLTEKAETLTLAGHLCGSWLKDLMATGDVSFTDEIPLWNHFKRIQLNFHAQKTELSPEALKALRNETWKNHKEFIIQMDGVNNELYSKLLFAGVLTSGLFDTSHGTGIIPDTWPDVIPSIHPKAYRGYAGGLGPSNISEQLEKLAESVGNIDIWIDMETNVRSNNDIQFDLDKVCQCLRLAKKWV